MSEVNREILLVKRPVGPFTDDCFELRESKIPSPGDGETLVKNLYLSLDPAMRGWVREARTYMDPVGLGTVMRGGTIAEVVESNNADYKPGDKLMGMTGWADYAIVKKDAMINKIPDGLPLPLTNFLSVLGITGLTAYFGLLDLGKPQDGETVLVSAAAGAVGSITGQIAKIKGCRVVGTAGTDAKCEWIKGELGFDAVINYKKQKVADALGDACPDGIDVYFDNVGGETLDAALARINQRARVVLCGAISVYNQTEPPPGPSNYLNLVLRSARMEGFIVIDFIPRFSEGAMQLAQWVMEGKIKHREHIVDGLENAPRAVRKLFDGTNDGKLIVKIADPG